MNPYLKKFIENTFPKPGTALDLGAGEFFDVACMERLGWRCEGVDLARGVDLEKPYRSANGPFDLVFSNYVLHMIKNKEQFVKTAFNNLKEGGWVFVHTFDVSDRVSRRGIGARAARELFLAEGFTDVRTRVVRHYDNDEGHKHWHRHCIF